MPVCSISSRGGTPGVRKKTADAFHREPAPRNPLTDICHALSQRAAVVTADHGRVDIAFAAYGSGIAQLLRDAFDDLELALPGRLFFFQSTERQYRQVGSGPRTKVLCGDFPSRDCAQVVIYIARINAMPLAVIIQILKQFRAWQVAAVLEDTRQLLVVDDAITLHTALGAEIQRDLVAFDRDVAILQSGQAEAVVLACVFTIADAGQRPLRKYYKVTRAGKATLEAAQKRYPLLVKLIPSPEAKHV